MLFFAFTKCKYFNQLNFIYIYIFIYIKGKEIANLTRYKLLQSRTLN